MEKEVKNAVKELLEKIPEDHLEKAAGGLTDRTKKILMGAGLFATGVGVGGGAAFLLSRKGKTPDDSGNMAVQAELSDAAAELRGQLAGMTEEDLSSNGKKLLDQYLTENKISQKDFKILEKNFFPKYTRFEGQD